MPSRRPPATPSIAPAERTLGLAHRLPLDFARMLAFLRKRAIAGVEAVDAHAYERRVGPADRSGRLRIADGGEGALHLTLSGVSADDAPALVQRVRHLFDLDADLDAVHAHLSSTPLLALGIARRPGLRVPGVWDPFESAVRAVLGQQISVAAATTLAGRLVDTWGARRVDAPVGLDRIFPPPEALVDAPLESIGLPKTRAASLRALAAAIVDGRVSFAADQPLDAFVASMVALPGIGPWTAHYLAMRGLGHRDAFPAGDLVLQRMMGGDEGRLGERETERRSQPWRPWRAYAVLHLWHLSGDPDFAR